MGAEREGRFVDLFRRCCFRNVQEMRSSRMRNVFARSEGAKDAEIRPHFDHFGILRNARMTKDEGR